MAENEPKKPEDVKIGPAYKPPAEKQAPSIEPMEQVDMPSDKASEALPAQRVAEPNAPVGKAPELPQEAPARISRRKLFVSS